MELNWNYIGIITNDFQSGLLYETFRELFWCSYYFFPLS